MMYKKRIMELFEQYYSSNIRNKSNFISIEEEELKKGKQIRIILKLPVKTQFIKHLDYLFNNNGIIVGKEKKVIVKYLLK